MFPRLGFGLGLRQPHYARVMSGEPLGVDWFEVVTDNFLGAGGNPKRLLRTIRDRVPVVLHGVSLSIGSIDPLDRDYLDALARLIAEIEPAIVSDHLSWSSFGGYAARDLYPLPYTEEALAHVVARVEQVQARLGRRILLENPSTYASFDLGDAGIPEPEFLAEVARRADCGILLDVNNVWVSCRNHGWDPRAYLEVLPCERVGQMHLAGHRTVGALLVDTHDQSVCAEVWALYAVALRRFGAVATCIERDDRIPPFEELVAELGQARQMAAETFDA